MGLGVWLEAECEKRDSVTVKDGREGVGGVREGVVAVKVRVHVGVLVGDPGLRDRLPVV